MAGNDNGITWLASYPKSGNTWLRCLLEAYRRNGLLDINDLRVSSSDGAAAVIQTVSPLPLDPLAAEGELLLRPAALLNLMAAHKAPFLLKTHFANLTRENCPPNIPPQFTRRAVYVVRDPRGVLPSLSRHFGYDMDKATTLMASNDFTLGGREERGTRFTRQWASSWSNHVASWTSEDKFPVHVMRYEDMIDDTAKELRDVLEFLEWEVDEDRITRAVEASSIERLKKAEEKHGFVELNRGESTGPFFGGGDGANWHTQIGKKWAERIEDDHREVMTLLGYLEREKSELTAVS